MNSRRLYGHALSQMRRYAGRTALAAAEVMVKSGCELLKPWPLAIVIDHVLKYKPLHFARLAELSQFQLLTIACLSFVLLSVAIAVLQVTANYATISIGQQMVNDLRAQMFEHLQRLSLSFHRRREVGDLMVRVAYDSFSIQTITMNGFFPVFSAGLMLGGMFAVMIKEDATLTVCALAVVPLLIALIVGVGGRIEQLASGARVKESRLYTVAHHFLSAIHVVQAFTREAESYQEFVRSSSESLGENLRLYTFQSVYVGAVAVMLAIGSAIVIYVGALHVMRGALSIGELVVFISYLNSLYSPIEQIFQTYSQVQSAKAGLRRCLELLDIEPEIRDRAGARPLARVRGEIEFEGVAFGYDSARLVLKGVSFKARAGETIAIVGPSGAGKTTLTSLLARFYEPQRGAILIDRQDIGAVTVSSLRENIAIVLQPPLVMSATMRANIALGRPHATDVQIRRAAAMARLEPVLARLPDGLDQQVGQGGQNLSEGEAQRVTIARALLKDAPILIMDEPTSALDAQTEALVLGAVQEAMRGRTTLVIAHRLATIQRADLILVLRDGVIEEQGTFAELIACGGFFSHLHSLQSWSKEAARAQG